MVNHCTPATGVECVAIFCCQGLPEPRVKDIEVAPRFVCLPLAAREICKLKY